MLPICEIGNPILRQIAAPVDDISSIQRLIDDMIETLHEAE
jgi:peptide deformylase